MSETDTAIAVLVLRKRIQEKLVHVAPSVNGRKHLGALDNLPRFVFVLDGADPLTAKPEVGVQPGGQSPAIHTDCWNLEVFCQYGGKDAAESETQLEEGALRMRQALITAIREVVEGGNYELRQTENIFDEDEGHRGATCLVHLQLHVPLYQAVIPSAEGGVVRDRRGIKWRPKAVDVDPGESEFGDGNYDVGEGW